MLSVCPSVCFSLSLSVSCVSLLSILSVCLSIFFVPASMYVDSCLVIVLSLCVCLCVCVRTGYPIPVFQIHIPVQDIWPENCKILLIDFR